MYVYIHVWTRTAHMRARLSTRTTWQTRTYTRIFTHANSNTHTYTLTYQGTELFFLCQFDTLFERRVFYWKLIVEILWIFCLFVCWYETQKSVLGLLLHLRPGREVKPNAIFVCPACVFPPKKSLLKICTHNGLWYKYFSSRKNLVLELTPDQPTPHACQEKDNTRTPWRGVGYLSTRRGYSVESSVQRISSKFLSWKRNDSSVVL